MATYPAALPNLTESIPSVKTTPTATLTAGRDHTDHHTQLAQELAAALAELGTNPKGSDASVKARLDRMQTEIASKVVVQDYTTPGTHAWTKPSGAVFVRVRLVGGGGGGASGSTAGPVNGAPGGGGGSSGTIIDVTLPASEVSASGNLTVGAGGTGGAAIDGFPSNAGTAGGSSIFDGITAQGGNAGGVPSSQTAGAAITSGASLSGDLITTIAAGNGGSGAAGSNVATASRLIPTSGGGGGGKSNTNVAFAGGEGGDYAANNLGWPTSGAAGGTAPGGAGTAGTSFRGVGQGGGGGGGASGATNGGAGGNGGEGGGGGGGGGAAQFGALAGRGGDGGGGRVTLYWYLA